MKQKMHKNRSSFTLYIDLGSMLDRLHVFAFLMLLIFLHLFCMCSFAMGSMPGFLLLHLIICSLMGLSYKLIPFKINAFYSFCCVQIPL